MANSGSDGTLSRRVLLVRGVVATSAVVLAACGGSSGSSGTVSTSPKSGTFDDTSFDLIINPNRAVLVSGTVGGKPAAATGSLYASGTATVKGVVAGLGLLARLTQRDQSPTSGGYQTTTHLDASVGQAPTALEGLFTLDSSYVFKSGVISGSNQGLEVHVNAMPLPGSGTGSSATISGAFGSTPLALSADIPSGGPGSVVGKVDARKVRFDVTNGPKTTSENFRNLRVTGNYSGPADLFALIIGGIAYFGA
jgi:hypothetical protein